ncbi:MAG: hypothetical protein EOO85_25045 [Pedobacter sp.]|nr:MAG: hypothetical protein EOO85_25045 [Pedobacter sp.]
MQKVTLINTQHTSHGKCNSAELLKILSSIKPDVIFCECTEQAHKIFKKHFRYEDSLVELVSIEEYVESNDAIAIYIDIDINNSVFNDGINDMFKFFNKHDTYKVLEQHHYESLHSRGFEYLNSEECIGLIQAKKQKEVELLEFGGMMKQRLNELYTRFSLEIDEREDAMVDRIYTYSKNNIYKQAVFIIGCGHRESIMEKVTLMNSISDIKLNWSYDISNLSD